MLQADLAPRLSLGEGTVDVFQQDDSRTVALRLIEQVIEIAVFDVRSEEPNRIGIQASAAHHGADGARLSITRRPVQEVPTPEWEPTVAEPHRRQREIDRTLLISCMKANGLRLNDSLKLSLRFNVWGLNKTSKSADSHPWRAKPVGDMRLQSGTSAFGGGEPDFVLTAFTQKGDSVARAKKHSAGARRSKLLQTFAKNHGLNIQTESAESIFCKRCGLEPPTDRGNLNPFSPQICIGDNALIVDPSDDPVLIEIRGSKIALTRALRNSRIKNPLLLVLFLDRRNCLYENVGFDVPSYCNGSGSPENPNSSNWGRILHRVGLRYFDGDDETISFLFPSRDKTSVALALALAGSTELG